MEERERAFRWLKKPCAAPGCSCCPTSAARRRFAASSRLSPPGPTPPPSGQVPLCSGPPPIPAWADAPLSLQSPRPRPSVQPSPPPLCLAPRCSPRSAPAAAPVQPLPQPPFGPCHSPRSAPAAAPVQPLPQPPVSPCRGPKAASAPGRAPHSRRPTWLRVVPSRSESPRSLSPRRGGRDSARRTALCWYGFASPCINRRRVCMCKP